jgi:hypothetical protein
VDTLTVRLEAPNSANLYRVKNSFQDFKSTFKASKSIAYS